MSQPAGDQVRRALAQFGQVRGLVFGQYGDWSHDVSSLVSLAAAATAGVACDRTRASGAVPNEFIRSGPNG